MDQTDFKKLMSDAKFYESYARFLEEESRFETWGEAVERVMTMHKEKYGYGKGGELDELIERAEAAYKAKLVLGAQRALQFGGEQLLKHQVKMYNCVSSYCDRAKFFGEFMYMLLCGAGAGFSVQYHHVEKLPEVAKRTSGAKTYVVEDSIEGWANAVDVLMSSYFLHGAKHPEYSDYRIHFDLTNIRAKGEPISGGFLAPGPEPLQKALGQIENLLEKYIGDYFSRKLEPIICYDICMYIADAVISGGVRRSATICLFSPEDEAMVKAKTGNWYVNNPQRARSNNSAVIVRDEITREKFHEFMGYIKEFGEPAFVFLDSKEFTFNPLKLAA